jgi:predicted TIM-barrel fold metal-dependent hydrolase
MINGHVRGEFLDNQKYWVIFECAQALKVPIYLHPTIPHPAVFKALSMAMANSPRRRGGSPLIGNSYKVGTRSALR